MKYTTIDVVGEDALARTIHSLLLALFQQNIPMYTKTDIARSLVILHGSVTHTWNEPAKLGSFAETANVVASVLHMNRSINAISLDLAKNDNFKILVTRSSGTNEYKITPISKLRGVSSNKITTMSFDAIKVD